MLITKRLEKFAEYPFLQLAKKVKETEKVSNKKILDLGAGIPDIKPSQVYIDKLIKYIKEDTAHYYPSQIAIPEFSKALILWYQKRFNVVLDSSEILPLLGAKDGISHLPLALLDEGDECLIPNPGYPAFESSVLIAGGVPIYYNINFTDSNLIDFIELEKRVSKKTRFMWVNFPSNPTGLVANKEILQKIINFARKHNIFIVYDNAYSEITFDNFIAPSILEIDGAKDIAIEIGSFSKTFSFAGFRMGWALGNNTVISMLGKIKSQMDSGLSIPLQKLGAFALTNKDTTWHSNMLENYQKRRDVVAKNLLKLGLTFSLAPGGLYIWAKIPDQAKDSKTFCYNLLSKKQILLTPGIFFGSNGDRYVRASICVNIDNIDNYF